MAFRPWCQQRAFTLIEIMIVVSILAIVLGISIPAINNQKKHAPMVQTVRELKEVFSHARARAIFDGKTKQVVFRPYEGTFALSGGGDDSNAPRLHKKSGLSGTINERVRLEMLEINLTDFRDQELAVVNFYPNGTCDETLVVLRSERGEQMGVTLETTTGLSTVLDEDALRKLAYGR